MPSVSRIVATIEESNLVADEILEELRDRLARSRQPVDLKSAVKWLVQKEHITSEQGRRLLARAGGSAKASAPGKAPPAPADDDDLQLFEEPPTAPPASKPRSGRPAASPAADDDGLEFSPLDDETEAAQPESAPRPATPPAPRWAGTPKQRPAPARRKSAEPAYEEAPAYDAAGPDIFGAAAPSGFDEEPPARQSRRKKQFAPTDRTIWERPFLLFGGGGLLLILIVIAALLWRIGRLSGDDVFKKAEEFYSGGSYTQAIEQYTKFLDDFLDHAEVSVARVHRGMARMRQAVDGARDFTKTQATAKEILQEIAPEEKFGEAQEELVALLPKIAEGLARQAQEKQDPALVKEAEEALDRVDKYVRKNLRPEAKLAEIRTTLELTRFSMGRDAALNAAVEGIQAAIRGGTPARAYEIRKELLKKYPTLAGDEKLREAVLELSKAEQAAVAFKAEPHAAAPAETPSPVEAEVVMADRQGKNAPGVPGRMAQVLAGGAAYAFDAESGQVLWRRFVGYDTSYVPRPIGVAAEDDLLVVDAQRQELLRVERRSGKIKWRFAVGEPFDAHPVVARGQVWLATREKKLLTIDVETGDSPGYVSLPQPLRVAPAFDASGQICYQLGESSNLFAITVANHQCREVLYLGHEPESIHVPPLVMRALENYYIFVVRDSGPHDSLLYVLVADGDGTNIRQGQEPVTLAGHVLAPLEASGRTLVAATDRGAIYAFEVNPPDPGPPLVKVADSPPQDRDPLVHYPLLKDTQLWIAGDRITKYDVLASRGKLEPRTTKDEGDIFLQQPALLDKVLVHARRRGNQAEVLVAAVSADDGSRYWETRIAAPPAAAPLTDAHSGRLLVFNRAGALFEFAPEDLTSGVRNARGAVGDLNAAFSGAISASILPGGGAAVSATTVGPRALIAPPAGPPQWRNLPDALGAPAVAFHGGLLVPGALGQAAVVEAQTGQTLLQPFQPRLKRGAELHWSTPLVLGEDDVLLADGESKLFRLGVAAKPEGHLVAVAEAELAGPIVSPLAVAGPTAYAVSGANDLVAFALGDGGNKTLATGKTWPLPGGAAWGPYTAGSRVLVSTHGQLLALENQEVLWQIDLQHGPLSGMPLVSGDDVLLTTLSGQLCRLSLASGEEQGVIELGEPIAAGPLSVGERLLVASRGGTLLVVAKP